MPDELSSAVHIINANTARIIPIPSTATRQAAGASNCRSCQRGAGGRGFGIATLEEVSRLLQLRFENTGSCVESSPVSSHNGRICNFSSLGSIYP